MAGLFIMAWTKAKRAIVVTAVILATGTTTFLVRDAVTGSSGSQPLADGSVLVLNRVSFGGTNVFIHGNALEKALKNVIPAKGVKLSRFKLTRPTRQKFEAAPGKDQLAAEFKVIGSNLVNHPLVNPAFYREFRCVIRGESGIEYVQEFWPGMFQAYTDGYFGYVLANRFPRDSRWLWLQIERRANQNQGGPWSPVAQFKIENRSQSKVQSWSADSTPTIKTAEGMDFILDQITVVTQSYSPRDIWNHVVAAPFQVRSNGAVLTNWDAAYVRVEDASGNWDYILASHRALDPRYVWKLEADFEPVSDYPVGTTATIKLPTPSSTITTNFLDVPVTISWDGYWVDVNMSTNRQDLALRFVCVTDDQGENTSEASGSWWQYSFRKGSFMWHKGGILTVGGLKPTKITFAIVPNVHRTFYAQPKLIVEKVK